MQLKKGPHSTTEELQTFAVQEPDLMRIIANASQSPIMNYIIGNGASEVIEEWQHNESALTKIGLEIALTWTTNIDNMNLKGAPIGPPSRRCN